MIFDEYYTLNDDVKLLKLGFGTWLIDDAKVAKDKGDRRWNQDIAT